MPACVCLCAGGVSLDIATVYFRGGFRWQWRVLCESTTLRTDDLGFFPANIDLKKSFFKFLDSFLKY